MNPSHPRYSLLVGVANPKVGSNPTKSSLGGSEKATASPNGMPAARIEAAVNSVVGSVCMALRPAAMAPDNPRRPVVHAACRRAMRRRTHSVEPPRWPCWVAVVPSVPFRDRSASIALTQVPSGSRAGARPGRARVHPVTPILKIA